MEDNMHLFKRPYDPIFQNGGNKRGKFGDPFSEISHSSDTLYRILCPSRKIGGVIGKGGVIIKALREETQAKIIIDDSVTGSEERVVLIYSSSTKKSVKQNDMNLQCAAQDALLKVHDTMLEEDNKEKLVNVRLLVPHDMVGCLLGKTGDVIQRLRHETGANICILPADQLPVCALSTDELVQISAKPAIAKWALYEVSTLLHQHPRRDNSIPLGHQGFHPPGPLMTNLPPPANPYARWQGDYDSDHSRIRSLEFDDGRSFPHGGDTPAEFSMKMLCPTANIGRVIGNGRSNARQIQQETGTNIHVDDVAADSDEPVSSFEMAPTTTSTPTPNNLFLRSSLEKDKLNHTNFLDWFRNLRIVLRQEKKLYVLDGPIPEEPPTTPKSAYDAWLKHGDHSVDVSCLMRATMIPDLQKDLEFFTAYDMITHLKEMFQQQIRTERFETVRALHACKMEEGGNVSAHVLNMKSHMEQLERLGSKYPLDLATDLILNSLPKSYDTFVMSYYMNGWEKPISELHLMLKTAEKNILKKPSHVLNIREGQIKKPKATNSKDKLNVGKGKGKKFPQAQQPKKKEKVAKEDACFDCGIIGHWKRNCPTYLAGLKTKKADAGTSGVSKE